MQCLLCENKLRCKQSMLKSVHRKRWFCKEQLTNAE